VSNEPNYKSNPLHGVGLKQLLKQIVDHYGYDILYAYVSIKCFKTNPSIDSSVKFLKKADWAREIVENFYLYEFKNLPPASRDQLALSPRDRVIPDDQTPGKPAELSVQDAERLCEKREKSPHERRQGARSGSGKHVDTQRNGFSSHRDSSRGQKRASESAKPSCPSPKGAFNPWARNTK
jgi:uncharacterized protein (DUF2132 family)